ncbi:MAG: sugar phosphate isomerase/epimerase family protein [Bacteroidota bacterium]
MRLGLFSVSYAGLWGQARLDPLSFLDKAASLGFTEVLLMAKRPHLSILDADQDLLRALKARLAEKSLTPIGLAAYNDFLLQTPAEIPALEMQLAYIGECARITAFLGGRLVRVFTGYERTGRSLAGQWDLVVSALREGADRVAPYGVTLVIQNHHDLAVDTRSFALLLDEVDRPNVMAGYDAWSPFLRGEDLYAGAKLMAPRAAMTIVADYVRHARYQYQPDLVNYVRVEPDLVRAVFPGAGEVDYGSFFRGLAEGGFDGPVVYEMCSPLIGGGTMANLDKHAAGFLSFMRSLTAPAK